MSREYDINKLCKKIMELTPEYIYGDNGPDEYECPLCGKTENSSRPTMNEFSHDIDCPYLIAKDLMTGVK